MIKVIFIMVPSTAANTQSVYFNDRLGYLGICIAINTLFIMFKRNSTGKFVVHHIILCMLYTRMYIRDYTCMYEVSSRMLLTLNACNLNNITCLFALTESVCNHAKYNECIHIVRKSFYSISMSSILK